MQGAKDPNAYTSQKLVSEATLHLASFNSAQVSTLVTELFEASELLISEIGVGIIQEVDYIFYSGFSKGSVGFFSESCCNSLRLC